MRHISRILAMQAMIGTSIVMENMSSDTSAKREMFEDDLSKVLENTHYKEHFSVEEKPVFGKYKKQLRNKQNPKKFKSKFNGKSNPFKKTSNK